MFYIQDSAGFYDKMIQDYDDFVVDTSSARHAINCATSAFHLAEWIWGDWLKTDHATWQRLGIRDRETFLTWLDGAESWFPVVQAIANGSKHFGNRHMTKFTNSYVEEGYVEDGYQQRLLEIETVVDGRPNWVEAIIVIEAVVMFWTDFLREYRPQAYLRKPLHPFTYMPD
jgi:hypothetical protein